MYEESIPVEFVGGSRDGEELLVQEVPEFLPVKIAQGLVEIYERKSETPPFILRAGGVRGRRAVEVRR